MFEIVTRRSAPHNGTALEEMFELRRKDLAGRPDLPAAQAHPDLVRDEYDDGNAIYLVMYEGGAVVAAFRLVRTTFPHLFSETFASLCSRPICRGPDVFEASRFCVDPMRISEEGADAFLLRLSCAAIEFMSIAGIRQVIALSPLAIVGKFLREGAEFKPLGPPAEIDGGHWLPVAISPDGDLLHRIRSRLGIRRPLLNMNYARETENLWRN